MDWSELARTTCERPGMYVRRPYVDGLTAMWLGFGLGAEDDTFDKFSLWVRAERFATDSGDRNPLSIDAILRRAVADDYDATLTPEQDDAAVQLLGDWMEAYLSRS